MTVSPIVKWPGGKRKMVPQLLDLIRPGDRLIEPFAGGMALSLAYDGPAIASDTNKRLMAMYEAVRDDRERLAKKLAELFEGYNVRKLPSDRASYYSYIRTNFNSWDGGSYEGAARLIFLNRTCFNGLYRVNKKGEFNVPHGKYKNPQAPNLQAASVRLQSIDLMRLTFSATLMLAGKGDTVYLDSPYDDGFVQYTKDGFDWDQQYNLAHWAFKASSRGARVIASNANTPRIRHLYQNAGFEIHEVQAGRSISCDGAGRGYVTELLMMRG